MNSNEYNIRITKAENGFLVSKEALVPAKTDSSFDEYETTVFVFTDADSLMAWMKDNID